MTRWIVLFLVAATLQPLSSLAQQRAASAPYDGIQAGLDAFRLAEEQRQVGVAQQLQHNHEARAFAGYSASRGATIYYGYPSLEAAYAYGYWPPGWPPGPVVFEPWPFVPGDIYGYPMNDQPARQPLGQTQTQTGPNRWESHPVYDPPLTPSAPLPPVGWAVPTNDSLDAASTRRKDVELIPPPPETAPSPSKGPREY